MQNKMQFIGNREVNEQYYSYKTQTEKDFLPIKKENMIGKNSRVKNFY